jgi:hypothetical protein
MAIRVVRLKLAAGISYLETELEMGEAQGARRAVLLNLLRLGSNLSDQLELVDQHLVVRSVRL